MPRSDQRIVSGKYQVVPRTLCFVTHDEEVLLLHGAADRKVWPNRYNGVGGHVEADEDVFSAAAREIREETGLEVSELRLRGVINAQSVSASTGVLIFVFTALAPRRDVIPSVEGDLEWVALARVRELSLVEDLPVLLDRLYGSGRDQQPFFAHYTYSELDELKITFAGSAPGSPRSVSGPPALKPGPGILNPSSHPRKANRK